MRQSVSCYTCRNDDDDDDGASVEGGELGFNGREVKVQFCS